MDHYKWWKNNLKLTLKQQLLKNLLNDKIQNEFTINRAKQFYIIIKILKYYIFLTQWNCNMDLIWYHCCFITKLFKPIQDDLTTHIYDP